jgi:magnesium transporter
VALETALQHVCTRVPVGRVEQRAGDLRDQLVGARHETVSLVVVRDGERVVGIVSMEDLLAAPADSRLGDVMDRDPPLVAPGVDQEVAAWRAARNGESALAVVDAEGRLEGVIPPYRLLEVLLAEHEEDLSRLGGFTRSSALARTSSQEPVDRRVRHRVPWLLVGLAGAIVAADLVGWFETALRERLILAFFVPGIVYLADAVGTQTETVVVRGLSLDITMRSMIVRELLTGLAIGLILALVAGPVVWWRWGEADIALGVSLAVFAACSTATIAAMGLPWLFQVLGRDPSFGSGPLATVIQDLSSILIYFVIVTTVVG